MNHYGEVAQWLSDISQNHYLRTRQQKSDNLQYNTLGRWDDHLIDQASDVPSIIFFIISCQNSLQKSFQIFILFFYNFTKIKSKEF